MPEMPESGGAVVDRRLEPAGLTPLLGPYGEARGHVLGLALVLLACAGLALVVLAPPLASVEMAFVIPVVLVAAEFGARAGLACAAASTAILLAWTLATDGHGSGHGVAGILIRALALGFLAWAVGRLSERAARSRRLLEQVIESTSDSIYVKDLDGRYLLVNSSAAQLLGRPGSEILGLSNAALLPGVAGEVDDHDARVTASQVTETYDLTVDLGTGQHMLSVTKSAFRDFAGTTIGTLGIARDVTGQRRSQSESARFFDLSGDMLCMVGFDGIIHRVNDEWQETLGWSSAELLGRSIFDFVAPDDHQRTSDATRAARMPGAPGAQLTTRWRAKDGAWRWIDWSLRTVDDERRVYASGRDVTQRRASQRALTRSESCYRALVHGLPGTAVLVFDHDLITELAAGQALTATGYGADELIGRHVSTMFAAPDSALIARDCEAALAGENRSFDGRLAGDAGHELWARTSPLRDEAGQIVGAMLIAQDVHGRVERERELGEVQERFRRAFDDAPIGMAVTDIEGGFLEVNQALCAISGHSAQDLCATTRMAITHPDDVAADVEAMEAMIAGRRDGHVVEKRYIRADGETVWVAVNVTVVRDPDGAPLNFLIQVQDVTDRRRFERELRHLADHDPLTGLFNRRRFEQELERHVSEVARYGPRGALLVLDLDHFKYINDALGPHSGDELLLAVAALLQSRLRGSDILARLGGDEFAVLLPTVTPTEAEHVATELLRAVREEAGLEGVSRRAGVTTSIGVALFRGTELTGEELLIEADVAMYDAKEAGRDRFAVVTPEAQRPDRIRARVSWLERIREALDDDRLVLHAQPIRDLRTGQVSQHELLVRMLDDRDELIPPGAFLPLAERFGLAPAIDRWVAMQAIGLLAADPHGTQALEVNLSGPSLNDQQLLTLIENEVAHHQIDPRRLIFEITETAAVANIPLARRFAERLMALGCRFALDDFGAGFGSFYYLKHLPFDYLKIDGEFVSGCLGSRTDQLIIESVVRIARGLGKETIAEFVSDESLESFLRSQGVDHAQGFHVGRPVPVATLLSAPANDSSQTAAAEWSTRERT